jgi:hypothetical protein
MEDDDGSREAVEIAQQQDAVRWFLDECILETTAVPDDCDGVAVCFDALAEMYVYRKCCILLCCGVPLSIPALSLFRVRVHISF